MSVAIEKSIVIDGLKYSYTEYHPDAKKTLIAIHGWLDNAASFEKLAPCLEGFNVLCLDLPGHGLSDHASTNRGYFFSDWVLYLAKFIDALKIQDDYFLLGHSMGAGVCTIYAGLELHPPKKIFLIDGLVPVPGMQKPVNKRLKNYIQRCIKKAPNERKFKNITDAYHARKIATPSMPADAVHSIMKRQVTKTDEGAWKLLSDYFLNAPSAMLFSRDEINELITAVTCDVVVFQADDPDYQPIRDLAKPHMSLIQNLKTIVISGSHYIHFERPHEIASNIY